MLRLNVALSEATVATRLSTASSDRPPSPSSTKLKLMSLNMPGLTSTTTTSIDTRKACQHYSWRAVKLSNNCVSNLRMEFENSDNRTAQLKPYTRAIQHVAESDNVARATAHLGDGCKTTERLPVDRQPIPARLPTRLHLYDEEESALSNASTSKKGDDGPSIVLKLAWSSTGEDFTIAIARSASLQRQLVPVLEGE